MNAAAESQELSSPDRRFLHTLEEYRRQGVSRDEYEIDGHLWWCHGFAVDIEPERDSLHLHIKGDDDQLRMLKVTVDASGIGYHWSYSLKVTDGIYVRAGGNADTAVEACAAAVDFTPETVTFEYLTETTWYSPGQNHWIAAIDGDEGTISCYRDDEYHWRREYAKATEVLAMTGCELSGYASSLEDAMRAAIDAPDNFNRACAALVGGIRKPAEPEQQTLRDNA